MAEIEVAVVYKDIRNLRIGVHPPDGRVRVSAPLHLDDESVRQALVERLPWITRHRDRLRAAGRRCPSDLVDGETHYVWGRRLELCLIESSGRPRIDLAGDRLMMQVAPRTSVEQRRALLDRWYRRQLRGAVPDAIARWEPVMGVSVTRWTIRRMRTRWGSCNPTTGHVTLNLELARRHPESLEYVVVHELAHLLERGHGAAFTRLMDGFLPDWRVRRDRLNREPPAPADG